jgi:hypothetical protein
VKACFLFTEHRSGTIRFPQPFLSVTEFPHSIKRFGASSARFAIA